MLPRWARRARHLGTGIQRNALGMLVANVFRFRLSLLNVGCCMRTVFFSLFVYVGCLWGYNVDALF